MKYVGDLITRVRNQTVNTGATATSGIQDQNILDYLNDGQTRIQSLLVEAYPQLFISQYKTSVIAYQRSYTIPNDAFIKNKVSLVEYSSDGTDDDFIQLEPVTFRELNPSEIDYPGRYAIAGNSVYLSPVPATTKGSIRITYVRALDELDTRRGQVASRTLAGTTLSALTLGTTNDDPVSLAAGSYLCVCDRDGTSNMKNIRYDSYASATGIVTLTGGSFTCETGETCPVGSWVTVGPYTITHSALADITERYLVKYAAMEILAMEDSSTDYSQAQQVLSVMEQDIVAAYECPTSDFGPLPTINSYYRL